MEGNAHVESFYGFCFDHIRFWFCRLPNVAAIEAIVRGDAPGGTRRGGLRGQVRTLPLSHFDEAIARARLASDHQGEGHALRRTTH
jgi:hypothetical protein